MSSISYNAFKDIKYSKIKNSNKEINLKTLV